MKVKLKYISKYSKIIDSNKTQCLLCSHYCVISNNGYGKCKVRKNIDNQLIAQNYGAITGVAIDPIEKKPLYHYMPGAKVLSFGCFGCNSKCINCQNYSISDSDIFDIEKIIADNNNYSTPDILLDLAIQNKCEGIAYTYSEPTVFWDFCEDIIKLAKINAPELKHIVVTNGFFSNELIKSIIENNFIDAMNIDLKFINNKYHAICDAQLKPILKNIENIYKKSNIQIEITNLLIPTLNDSDDDIKKLCDFIANLSTDIPIHFSKFFPIYKSKYLLPTFESTLLRAREIAEEVGLKYVYIGNTELANVSDTHCPECHELMIKRNGYSTNILGVKESNFIKCNKCNFKLKIK